MEAEGKQVKKTRESRKHKLFIVSRRGDGIRDLHTTVKYGGLCFAPYKQSPCQIILVSPSAAPI